MADQLASPQDLASLLQLDYAGLTPAQQATMTMLVEIGTAIVQNAAGGQRIVQVAGDTASDLIGSTESWLWLPQQPVTAVTSVTLDGVALTEGTGTGQWQRFGSRLWRDCGWAACAREPSRVAVAYTHGLPTGDQGLQFARGAVLGLVRGAFDNPGGVVRLSIDDYSAAYEAVAARMEASPFLRKAIRRQYGRKGPLMVKVGG